MTTKRLEVVITGDAKQALLALANTKGGLSGLASQMKTLPGFAATAGVAIGAGLVAAGVGLFKLGQDFDDAFDKIRVGTGATGKKLEGLKASFKNVFASVPTDMDSAATAISGLNQRLGLTGKPLERMAIQVLELSRLTGEDLGTAIETTSRVMGDWNIPAGKQSKVLDELFRASQATGIGVNELADKVVQFGAPMRQFGFSFEESAALMAKWEKEGVNSEAVLAGLKVGLGKLLKAGKDPVKVLTDLQQSFAKTGGSAEDVQKVLEIFGTRAGPDMVAALREGRFSIDDLLKTIKGGKETIRGAAKDTNDFGETWTILKNQVLVALEPIATKVFNAISSGMKALVPIIKDFRKQWPAIMDGLRPVLRVVEYVFDNVVARVKASLDGIIGIVKFFGAVLKGDWGKAWQALRQVFKAVWDSIKAIFRPAVDALRKILGPVLTWVRTIWSSVWGHVREFLRGTWERIRSIVSTTLGAIRTVLSTYLGIIRTAWSNAWGAVRTAFRSVVDAILAAFGFLRSGISNVWGRVSGFIRDIPGRIVGFFSNLGERMLHIGESIVKGIWRGIQAAASWLWDKISGFVDDIVDAVKDPLGIFSPSKVFAEVGRNMVRGVAVGWDKETPKLEASLAATSFVRDPGSSFAPPSPTAGGGRTVNLHVTVNVPALSQPAETGRAVADALAAYLRNGGLMPTARVASGA